MSRVEVGTNGTGVCDIKRVAGAEAADDVGLAAVTSLTRSPVSLCKPPFRSAVSVSMSEEMVLRGISVLAGLCGGCPSEMLTVTSEEKECALTCLLTL